MRRVAAIWALVVAGLVGVLVWDSQPKAVTVPNSRLVFDKPASWRATDGSEYLDPSWAEEEKRRYPKDAALIDSTVEMFRTGRIDYSAFIELDDDHPGAEGLFGIAVHPDTPALGGLLAEARSSVDRQPMKVRSGTSAVEATLPLGPAARLDWSFDLEHADGTVEIGNVRSYWLSHEGALVIAQVTTYGDQPDAVASFEAAVRTFRWGG